MLEIYPYGRNAAVAYAHRWAYRRNPAYFDFSKLGGDCTNFASQCLYAGSGVMNFTPVYGWFYRGASDRTASWTGVKYLYNFLVSNTGAGPFASDTTMDMMEPGDLVQLAFVGKESYHHTPVIVSIDGTPTLDSIYIAAHSNDSDLRPLSSYNIAKIRFLHIEGVRNETPPLTEAL